MNNRTEVQQLRHEVLDLGQTASGEFAGLNAVQLNWKPSVDRWSVAQCFDHLITTNAAYFPTLESIVNGTRKKRIMERVPVLPALWARLFMKSLDPSASRKLKAPAQFHPSSSDISESIISDFDRHQHRVADMMVATEQLNLDKIVISSPVGGMITYSLMDAYRILVVHEQRHFQQARRVCQEQKFPRVDH